MYLGMSLLFGMYFPEAGINVFFFLNVSIILIYLFLCSRPILEHSSHPEKSDCLGELIDVQGR